MTHASDHWAEVYQNCVILDLILKKSETDAAEPRTPNIIQEKEIHLHVTYGCPLSIPRRGRPFSVSAPVGSDRPFSLHWNVPYFLSFYLQWFPNGKSYSLRVFETSSVFFFFFLQQSPRCWLCRSTNAKPVHVQWHNAVKLFYLWYGKKKKILRENKRTQNVFVQKKWLACRIHKTYHWPEWIVFPEHVHVFRSLTR